MSVQKRLVFLGRALGGFYSLVILLSLIKWLPIRHPRAGESGDSSLFLSANESVMIELDLHPSNNHSNGEGENAEPGGDEISSLDNLNPIFFIYPAKEWTEGEGRNPALSMALSLAQEEAEVVGFTGGFVGFSEEEVVAEEIPWC